MNSDIVNFTKQFFLNRATLPQEAIALYPENTENTTVSVNVSTTQINIRYISATTQTVSIAYADKSVDDIAAEINRVNIPVRAVSLSRARFINAGDFVSTGGEYLPIPNGFGVYDRTTSSGIVLRLSRFSYRNTKSSKIKLLQPYIKNLNFPWFPRLSVGSFTQQYKGELYYFSVPEYDNQTWSTKYGKPFKDVRGATPIFVDDRVVQVSRFPMFVDGNVSVFNGDVPMNESIIQDIDTNNGLVYFSQESYLNRDTLSVNYTYLEKTYEYKDININCHFEQNPALIDQFVLIYLVPNLGGFAPPTKRTVYHTVGNSVEECIAKIPNDYRDFPVAIIGAYNVQQIGQNRNLSSVDTRVKGGGLVEQDGPTAPQFELPPSLVAVEDRFPAIEETYKEGYRFFDIGRWDGEPYPGAAAVIVQLPDELEDNLALTDIKRKATKFLPAGTAPVFEFETRPLPLVTGDNINISTQIDAGLAAGHNWNTRNYEIPSGTVVGAWLGNEDFSTAPKIVAAGNTNAIEIGDTTGYYQAYLKSSADAAIEWEEREVFRSIESGMSETYSSWTTRRIKNTTPVPSGEVIKDFFSLPESQTIKQYRNIKIHSPYPKEFSFGIKDKLKSIILEMHSGLADLTGQSSNIRFQISDIRNDRLELVDNYLGIHPSQEYLYASIGTDITGQTFPVIETLRPAFDTNFSATGELSAYFPVSDEYQPINSAGDFTITRLIETAANNTYYARNVLGEDSDTLAPEYADLSGIVSKIETKDGYYVCDYRLTPAGEGDDIADYSISGYPFNLPENFGFDLAETLPQFNQDFNLMNLCPGFAKYARAFDRLTWLDWVETKEGKTINTALSNSITALGNRANASLNNDRTISGSTAVQNYYTSYNRFGQYVGTTTRDLTDAYDIYREYFNEVNLNLDGEFAGLSLFFGVRNAQWDTLTTILDSAYTGMVENLFRGGVSDAHYCNSIRAYGWWANRAEEHSQQFWSDNTFDAEKVAKFSGLYQSGVNYMTKLAVTPQGYVIDSKYVDQISAPTMTKSNVNIFPMFSPGIEMDSGAYLPMFNAVLDTFVSKYNVGGAYYTDGLLQRFEGTRQFELLPELTYIYKLL